MKKITSILLIVFILIMGVKANALVNSVILSNVLIQTNETSVNVSFDSNAPKGTYFMFALYDSDKKLIATQIAQTTQDNESVQITAQNVTEFDSYQIFYLNNESLLNTLGVEEGKPLTNEMSKKFILLIDDTGAGKQSLFTSAKTKELIKNAKIDTVQQYRFCILSDLYYANESYEGIGGYTSTQRAEKMVEAINTQNKKSRLDFVILNGNITYGLSNLTQLKDNVLVDLDIPYYLVYDSSLGVNSNDFENLFGYSGNYAIEMAGCGIAVLQDSSLDNGNVNKLQNALKNTPNTFIVSNNIHNSGAFMYEAIQSSENIIGGFAGGTQSIDYEEYANKPFFGCGHFSQGQAVIDEFPWNFRVVEYQGGALQTFVVYPEITYMPYTKGGYTLNEEYTKHYDIAGNIDIADYSEAKKADVVISARDVDNLYWQKKFDDLTDKNKEFAELLNEDTYRFAPSKRIETNLEWPAKTQNLTLLGQTTITGMPSLENPAQDQGKSEFTVIVNNEPVVLEVGTQLHSYNNIKDTVSGNKVTRRIAKVVLNGSSLDGTWHGHGSHSGSTPVYSGDVQNLRFRLAGNAQFKLAPSTLGNDIYCDSLETIAFYSSNGAYTADYPSITTYNTSEGNLVGLRIPKTLLNYSPTDNVPFNDAESVTRLKAYLTENPITIYFAYDENNYKTEILENEVSLLLPAGECVVSVPTDESEISFEVTTGLIPAIRAISEILNN